MSDLQTAFYIIGIVFMSLMLLIGLVLVVAVLVIRSKVNALHDKIDEKLNLLTSLTSLTSKGGAVLGAIKKVTQK